MANFLDETGLQTVWGKVTSKISSMISEAITNIAPTLSYAASTRVLTVGKSTVTLPLATSTQAGLMESYYTQAFPTTVSSPSSDYLQTTAYVGSSKYGVNPVAADDALSWGPGALAIKQASSTSNGIMSKDDKIKLDKTITVDTELPSNADNNPFFPMIYTNRKIHYIYPKTLNGNPIWMDGSPMPYKSNYVFGNENYPWNSLYAKAANFVGDSKKTNGAMTCFNYYNSNINKVERGLYLNPGSVGTEEGWLIKSLNNDTYLNIGTVHALSFCIDNYNENKPENAKLKFQRSYDWYYIGFGNSAKQNSYIRFQDDGDYPVEIYSNDAEIRIEYDINLTAGGNIIMNQQPSIKSDKRLKENIKDIDKETLKKLANVNYKQFNLNGKSNINYGVIAQDLLENDLVDLVSGSEKDFYSVDYLGLHSLEIALLKQEVKELKELVKNLSN